MIYIIEKSTAIPLYLQIKENLLQKIKAGNFVTDQKIPSENELKEIYNVSQITVRKALSELVNEGYLYRQQGKGTFVAKRKINRMLNLMSFTEEMRYKELNCSSRVMEIRTINDHAISRNLGLISPDPVYKVERLRFSDDLPIAIQTSYIPESIISLEKLKSVLQEQSLYKVLNSAGIYPYKARERYNADILVDDRLCKLLQLEKGDPVFKVKRYTYTEDELLFEYAESVLKGDIYTMEVELRR